MTHEVYDLRKNLSGRWYIVHPLHSGDSGLAWSGSRWAAHYKGMPIARVQIANFATPSELHKYALEHIERMRNETAATAEATIDSSEESTD